MPIMKCQRKGQKFGKSGKCYTGPGARKKAAKQGAAQHIRKGTKKRR